MSEGRFVAAESRSLYGLANAHLLFASVPVFRGKPEDILSHAREAMRLCEERQVPFLLGVCWMMEGYGHYYQEDFRAARECAERAIQLMLEHGPALSSLPPTHCQVL